MKNISAKFRYMMVFAVLMLGTIIFAYRDSNAQTGQNAAGTRCTPLSTSNIAPRVKKIRKTNANATSNMNGNRSMNSNK